MSAHAFLDQLESQHLLDDAIIADLRRQVDGSTRAVNAETIAKLLVDNGHLTKFQATKLVSELGADGAESGKSKRRRKGNNKPPPPPPPQQEEELGLLEEDEDGLAPLESDGGGGLEPLNDSEGLAPLDSGGGLEPLDNGGGLEPLDAGGLEPLGDGGLEPLGGGPPPPPDALSGDALSAPEEDEAAPKKRKGPKKVVNRENLWDSPLLLVGGGALLLLLVAGAFLYMSLTRGTAQEMFNLAEEDYRAQSYTASIAKYEKFLKTFPQDPNASLARVRIGMARVRTAIENSTDPQKGLEACRQELPKIEPEESFGEARVELSSLLPELAMKFAEQADNANDIDTAERNVAKIDEAMELVNNPSYIPTNTRKEIAVTLDNIQELKNKVEREIGRNKALATYVAKIEEKTEADETEQAYGARKELLKLYPGLSTHPDLIDAVDQITARARSLVANQPLGIQPVAEGPESDTLRVLLAGNAGRSLPGGDKHLALAKVDGAVYGVDAATGRTLWRRFVGYDSDIEPVLVSRAPGADALIADSRSHELMRIKADDGSVVWRLPLGEPFNTPVMSADEARVIVSTKSGIVAEIDTATGEPSVAAKIPQQLNISPGRGDARRPMIYQIADHDNLYVINTEDLVCKQVYHLGHKQGSVVAPPVMAVGHVFIVVNMTPERSMLYVLAGDENGQQLTPAQPPIQLEGQVSSPLMVMGRRVALVTDLGAVNIFDVAPQKEDQPPVSLAVKPRVATFQQPTYSHALIEDLRMWIANERLVHYEVQTAKGEFVQKEIGNQGDVFVGPLQRVAKGLIHVRKPSGSPGVLMQAVNDRDLAETIWRTELGVPAATVVVQGSNIFVVSGRGQVYPVNAEAVKQGFATPASEPDDSGGYYSHATQLKSGVSVAVSQTLDWLAVDPAGRQQRGKLQGVRGAVVADLTAMGDGVLVPLDSGQVAFVDVAGRPLAHPFQPQLEAGGSVAWQRPAVIGDDEFVIANNQKTIYLVGVNDRGAKHLGLVKEVGVPDNIVSPLAFAGGKVWGVVRTNEGDKLVSYDSEELSPVDTKPLDGRVTSGPTLVGEDLFVSTTGQGFVCLDQQGEVKWTLSLTSELSGAPTLANGVLLLGLVEGRVLRVDAATGETLAAKTLDEPIRTAVLAFGQRVMTTGIDGTLLVTSLEQPSAEAPLEPPSAEAATVEAEEGPALD